MGHLTKWLFFNLLFGAIPYILMVALNQLQFPGSPLLHPSSEVLFIAVVATSSALGELWDGEENPWVLRSPWRGRWKLFLLLGVLSSSLLYGAYVYNTLISPGREHGIDCAAASVRGGQSWIGARDMTVAAAWKSSCSRWVAVQDRFFLVSVWLTVFWVVMSVAGVCLYPARRGGRNGVV